MKIFQLRLVLFCICLFCLVVFILLNYLYDENYYWTSQIVQNYSIPEVFLSAKLWRSQSSQLEKSDLLVGKLNEDDRILFQWQWVINVSQSDYMRSAKKKRILLTGNFNLDDEERKLPCHEPGVNFSQFCELIEDYWYDPRYQNYDHFDAVLIRRDWSYQMYEPKIPPSKITFLHIQESPYTFHQGDFRVNNPVLASYWRGSDIVVPYYKWLPHNSAQLFNMSQANKTKNYAKGKRKLVAMVASHCPTYNDRLAFVYELQKYISVDVFGSCGPFECSSGCFDNINKDYKFYLAFENANCRDYITEKFFKNALGNDIVPVVLGAHPEDYKYAAPPNSYIHVEDFKSPQELATYLITLDNNDTLYNKFFEWKGSGDIVNGHRDIFCRVCAFLFYSDFHRPPQWPPESSSWLKVNPCLKPGQHYWSHSHDNSTNSSII